jgi:transcriptional regulator with XRE-family HTH domain
MRAGLSQVELAERSGKDRAQIARWERDVVTPGLETLREVLQACGFDLDLQLVLYEPPDAGEDARLREELSRTPQERLVAMQERLLGKLARPPAKRWRT